MLSNRTVNWEPLGEEINGKGYECLECLALLKIALSIVIDTDIIPVIHTWYWYR